jgi:hypothetical protein
MVLAIVAGILTLDANSISSELNLNILLMVLNLYSNLGIRHVLKYRNFPIYF